MSDERPLAPLTVHEGVATITLTNPKANGYSYAMMRQIDAGILEARMRADVHVIVIKGAGEKFFCAGADIAQLQGMDPTEKYYFCLHANETLCRFEQTPKLVIAAINGHCVGGGLEVAMACDLRIARAGGGKVGLPEVKLGVLPGTGGTQRLLRLLGRAKALELMITGETFDMERAHELGLLTGLLDAAPGAPFQAAVHAYARRFVPPHAPSQAIGFIKRAVQTGAELPLSGALGLERELQQRLFCADDAREGIAANREKRAPSYTGR